MASLSMPNLSMLFGFQCYLLMPAQWLRRDWDLNCSELGESETLAALLAGVDAVSPFLTSAHHGRFRADLRL